MWRLLPLAVLLLIVSGVVLSFAVVLPGVRRREARKLRREKRLADLEEYQQNAALEDLEKTRARINADQDGYYERRAMIDPPV